jgi:hypothetical protein
MVMMALVALSSCDESSFSRLAIFKSRVLRLLCQNLEKAVPILV